MNLNKKAVFLTGAGGFIGSHLIETLHKKGASIKALVHYNSRGSWGFLDLLPSEVIKNIEIIQGDICDSYSMKNMIKGCDAVFHLAALTAIPYSYQAPAAYISNNVVGMLNLLQAGLDAGVERFIYSSSSEVYGAAQYVPIDEKHPIQARSPYSASKISAEKIAESYYRSYGLPLVTVRLFNVYGPRQSARAIIPTIICQALNSDTITIGSLDPVRDMTFVKDAVQAFIKAAESDNVIGDIFNIGMGEGQTIAQFIDIIKTLTGKEDMPVVQDAQRTRPAKSEVHKRICNNAKARELLGWSPEYTLEKGLKEVIAFIDKHPKLYRPDIYDI